MALFAQPAQTPRVRMGGARRESGQIGIGGKGCFMPYNLECISTPVWAVNRVEHRS